MPGSTPSTRVCPRSCFKNAGILSLACVGKARESRPCRRSVADRRHSRSHRHVAQPTQALKAKTAGEQFQSVNPVRLTAFQITPQSLVRTLRSAPLATFSAPAFKSASRLASLASGEAVSLLRIVSRLRRYPLAPKLAALARKHSALAQTPLCAVPQYGLHDVVQNNDLRVHPAGTRVYHREQHRFLFGWGE
jgi:hypothetical protein